jgi:hypothetical protein
MKAFSVAVAALVSMFSASVIWLAVASPFRNLVGTLNATLCPGLPAPAKSAMNGLVGTFYLAITLFIILTIIGLIGWWWLKMQEREVRTEAVFY